MLENKITLTTPEVARENGFGTFVNREGQTHICIDLTEDSVWDKQTTISIKMPNNNKITITPMFLAGTQVCLDIATNNGSNSRVTGWKEGKGNSVYEGETYALIIEGEGK